MTQDNAKVLGMVSLGSMGLGAALSALRSGVVTVEFDAQAEARARFAAEGGRSTDSRAAPGAQSDAVVVLDAARKQCFPLPLAAAAHQLYLAAAAAGHGDEDDAAVIKVYPGLAGLALPQAGPGLPP